MVSYKIIDTKTVSNTGKDVGLGTIVRVPHNWANKVIICKLAEEEKQDSPNTEVDNNDQK